MTPEEMASFSITANEAAKLEHEYEINDMIVYIRKAIIEVGDIKMSEAIDKLLAKTRFSDELKHYN